MPYLQCSISTCGFTVITKGRHNIHFWATCNSTTSTVYTYPTKAEIHNFSGRKVSSNSETVCSVQEKSHTKLAMGSRVTTSYLLQACPFTFNYFWTTEVCLLSVKVQILRKVLSLQLGQLTRSIVQNYKQQWEGVLDSESDMLQIGLWYWYSFRVDRTQLLQS